ncbi:MAG TPA: hypothetical protein VM493_09330 [Vicinamibacterales bacterium]|nr:hypothetical protein [Vicinamibacterales bacterium]
MEMAAEWLAASEAGALRPPGDVHDAAGWDSYWRAHIRVGPLEQGFSDMMSSDPELPALLLDRSVRTILCVGNGLSAEAFSLALCGFEVTALDISAVPAELIADQWRHPEHPLHTIPGFTIDEENVVRFTDSGPIETEHGSRMHRGNVNMYRGGGSLKSVIGDLVNAAVCPGPFDVVIERRTLQLFPPEERIHGLERLVARLASRGMFVSQQHSGGWRPGQPRTHYAQEWLRSAGFVMRSHADGAEANSAPRLASLTFSTG